MTQTTVREPAGQHAGGAPRRHVGVLIIGSGFAGLGAAIRLAKDGRDDFLVVERGSEVGGTWRDNTYPGAACDVPSHLYSYSFELNPKWSRSFSPQPEIQDYLRGVAAKYRVGDKHLFDTEVTLAQWDAGQQRWLVDTTNGSFSADVVVAAVGALCEPKLPDIPGIENVPRRDLPLRALEPRHVDSRASASRSSAPARRPSRSARRSSTRPPTSTSTSAPHRGSCRGTTARTPGSRAWPTSPCPACSASPARRSTGAASRSCSASATSRASCSSRSGWPSATSPRPSRTRSCARP